jgi:hypothetical protein
MSARPAGPAATLPPAASSAATRGLPRGLGSPQAALPPGRPQAAPGFAPSREGGYLGAPVAPVAGAGPVGVLTPPAGSKYDSDYAGPETVAWSMSEDTDSGEIEVLEEYWEQDDVEYSALLTDLADEPVGTGFDVEAQPAVTRQRIGRRRGRSGDRRLWFGLGGVVAVAAAAIFLIIQFEFPSDGGPAHTLSMPDKIGSSFVSSKVVDAKALAGLRAEFVKMTNGQATDVQSGTYESGGPTTGGTPQIVMTIEAHLANDDPASSIGGFKQDYPNAVTVPAGPLGGQAACAESTGSDADDVAICAWFDNDSIGALFSPSMNAKMLASELQTFRSAVEHVAKA